MNYFDPITSPVTERSVPTADGDRLIVRSYGPRDAPPIVFAHGWMMSADIWRPQINELSKAHRVITYHQRGHGSSTLTRPVSERTLGDDLELVLKSAVPQSDSGSVRALVVGHSMGGMTIQSWAKYHPDAVAQRAHSVVLAATSSGHISLVPPLRRDTVGRWLYGRAARAYATSQWLALPPAYNRRVFRDALGRVADQRAIDLTADIGTACPTRTKGAWGQVLMELDVIAGTRNLNVPTVVVAGAEDRVIPGRRHPQRMVDALTETGNLRDFQTYQGSGHQVFLERPEIFNELLAELVRDGESAA